MEIKFSCGEDGISEYLDDGWKILKKIPKKKFVHEICSCNKRL